MKRLIYILLFFGFNLQAQNYAILDGKRISIGGSKITILPGDFPPSSPEPDTPSSFNIIKQISFAELIPGHNTDARWQTFLGSSDVLSSWERDSTKIMQGDTVLAAYIIAVFNSNGTNVHGRMFLNGLNNTADTLTYTNLEYYGKFSSNWDFSVGGKIPNLAGDRLAGDAITYGNNGSGVYPDGCGDPKDYEVDDGFSARGGFGPSGNDTIGFYYYHHDLSEFSGCGILAYGDHFKPWTMPTLDIWYKFRFRMVLNTVDSPGNGNNDGILGFYINDELIGQRTNIRFRNYEGISIDMWGLSAFCGGGGMDPGRTTDQFFYIDDLTLWNDDDRAAHIIGQDYVGPDIGSDNRDDNP